MTRPVIAIPGRFADKASFIRESAIALSERLMESIHRAGGEPIMIFPKSLDELESRFDWIDGVLLPGGGDVNPLLYADAVEENVYAVNDAQDAFDIALIRWAFDRGIPLLAICRGFQVVNVALGGTLEQDMDEDHKRQHQITVSGAVAEITGPTVLASCYHHQRVERLAEGLRVLATDSDGTVEAADLPNAPGWFLGLQWHPEDTAAVDGDQANIFSRFVSAAAEFSARR